jgi:glycosyltransferase involved in cell wall biosynthesis
LRLAALVDGPTHVCCRYRIAAFRSTFAAAGFAVNLPVLPGHWWSRLALFRRLRGYDVVLLQRKLLPSWQLHFLRKRCQTLIFDFDDAVCLRDSHSKKGLHSPSRMRRFRATVQAADLVVAGNHFLADLAQRLTQRHKVHCIPTCVDPDKYSEAAHQRAGAGVVLTWIGSASTLRGLSSLVPVLDEAGRRQPGMILKLICDRFFSLGHMRVEPRAWSETTEVQDLATSDIGLSWLPDDDWSRGKCGLKLLQYMAAGLPVVANPVGLQVELVRHGENGFLASTQEEWLEAIRLLADNPKLRQRMGHEGRNLVRQRFSVAAGAREWLDVLKRIAGRRAA